MRTERGRISGYDIGVRVGQYQLSGDGDSGTTYVFNGISAVIRRDNIAVLRLDKYVPFARFHKPICSPRHKEYNTMISDGIGAVGQTAFLVGYQYYINGKRVISNVPIESSVVIANLCECRKRWPRKTITDSNVCVRGIAGNISYGAMGTPLMCQDSKTNRYALCGVGSFGFEDGKDGYSVYTNMRKYENLIRYTKKRDRDRTVYYASG